MTLVSVRSSPLASASSERPAKALRSLVPADWGSIAGVDGRAWDEVPQILIACDVTNPLLGPNGALAVYGPQKGLRPEDAAWLEGQSARLAGMLCRHFGRPPALESMPGAGAAGGIAFGLMAGAGATLLPGFDVVASWVDLEERLAAARRGHGGRVVETDLSGLRGARLPEGTGVRSASIRPRHETVPR